MLPYFPHWIEEILGVRYDLVRVLCILAIDRLGDQWQSFFKGRFHSGHHFVTRFWVITVFTCDMPFTGFPGGSDDREYACNAGELGLIPGLGRSPGEGNAYPLQYSCLDNPMDRGAWRATLHRVTESRTRLSDFTFTFFHFGRKLRSILRAGTPMGTAGRGTLPCCCVWVEPPQRFPGQVLWLFWSHETECLS